MPILSLLKKLVSGEPAPAPAEVRPAEREEQSAKREEPSAERKVPLPPPPPMVATPSTHTASVASLRAQVESERQTASSSSLYRDFTGGGHADAGHWNDPPTVVFKPQAKQRRKAPETPPSEASSFMMVDSAVTPNGTAVAEASESASRQPVDVPEGREAQAAVLMRALRGAVPVELASPMLQRMADDTRKRLALLDERLPALDDALVSSVCVVALLIDTDQLAAASEAHRALLQSGCEAELKWLLGIKRIIELRQKTA